MVSEHTDAEAIAIHANHTSMVRYRSKQNVGYVTVSEHLQIMTQEAVGKTRKRWEAEARLAHGKDP